MSGYIFGAFYDITRRIPAGKVATYGQIARLAGMPRCARIVGYATAACQDPSVPCHRVVDRFGSRGRSLHPGRPGGSHRLPVGRQIVLIVPFYIQTPADAGVCPLYRNITANSVFPVRQRAVHRRPVCPDGLAQGGYRLMPGIRLVAFQRRLIRKF